jgi:hypothetical protein
MNLSPYIAELLKTNDCVIVPDFGGFIANFHSSGYDERGDQFSPPSKEIIFSSKLKKNDGLLVNFVGEREGVGYFEARKIVAEFVSETIFELENGKTINLDEIGTLCYDQHENFLFEVDQKANFRVDTFGLESIYFPLIAGKHTQLPRTVFRDKDPEPQKRKYPVVKYALVGLPILALLYFIPLKKLVNYGESHQSISNTASLSVTDSPVVPNPGTAPMSALSEPKAEKSASGNREEVKTAEPLADHAPVTPKITPPDQIAALNTVANVSTGRYHVVGGCFKVKENADNLADKLVKQGYPAVVSKHGKEFFKVTVESFETRKEAEQRLSKILKADPETGYWLMADKR